MKVSDMKMIGFGSTKVNHSIQIVVEPAKKHGARYANKDYLKAVLHTWLAWQKEPGRPYGTAIKARYFGANSAAVKRFINWFRNVFGAE